MGCDIHSFAVDRDGSIIRGGKWADGKTANPECQWLDDEGEPFGGRKYSVFGFLAGVRNYSGVAPISEPRGLPFDFKYKETDDGYIGDHSFSWLSVEELRSFNYDAYMVDRRVTRHFIRDDGSYGGSDGGVTAAEGVGKAMTWREFLGESFFDDLAELQRINADRVVFGFDS